jgi:hypothetical protein
VKQVIGNLEEARLSESVIGNLEEATLSGTCGWQS